MHYTRKDLQQFDINLGWEETYKGKKSCINRSYQNKSLTFKLLSVKENEKSIRNEKAKKKKKKKNRS